MDITNYGASIKRLLIDQYPRLETMRLESQSYREIRVYHGGIYLYFVLNYVKVDIREFKNLPPDIFFCRIALNVNRRLIQVLRDIMSGSGNPLYVWTTETWRDNDIDMYSPYFDVYTQEDWTFNRSSIIRLKEKPLVDSARIVPPSALRKPKLKI